MNKSKTFKVIELIRRGILTIGDGYRAKNEELSIKGLPFARVGNISNGFDFEEADCFPEENLVKVGEKQSCPGDVVFTSKGTVGRFSFVSNDTPRFVYSPQLCYWRVLDNDTISPRFLFYWMQGKEFFLQYNGVKGQTDMADYVSLTDQRRMHISLPHIDQQRAIARILGALDDKIELNRRQNATLEKLARAIFQSWFVDFDPVRAKAEGRAPAAMDAATAALFPDGFEVIDGREVPRGWGVKPLEAEVHIAKGLSYKGSGLDDNAGMAMHNLNSIFEGGGYKYTGIKRYTGEYQERHIVVPGDLIVANTEQTFDFLLIGCPAIIPRKFGQRGLFSHHLFRVRPKTASYLTTHFIFLQLMSQRLRDEVVGYSNGTTVNMLPNEALQRPKIVIPPEPLVRQFQSLVLPTFEKQEHMVEENESLATLRDTLLPKLLSGEIRVRDAERLVEEQV